MGWLIGGGVLLLFGLLKKKTATPSTTNEATGAAASTTTPTGAGSGIIPYQSNSQPVNNVPASGMVFSAATKSDVSLPNQTPSVAHILGINLTSHLNKPPLPVSPAIQNRINSPTNAGTAIGVVRIPAPSTKPPSLTFSGARLPAGAIGSRLSKAQVY